jgi:hypothetical protein
MKIKFNYSFSVLIFLLFIYPLDSFSQEFPTKPIKFIVTTPPGGLIDILGRLIAQPLSEKLGQSVIVENKTGATTSIGVESVIKAIPDGYTLLIGTSEMTMLSALKKNYPYDVSKDLKPIALMVNSWTVFAINPKLQYKNLSELIEFAKNHPNEIRYGTNGIGGSLHLAVELLSQKAGIKLTHIPYKGGAQAGLDVISGHIEMVSMGIASTKGRREQLRVLAQTGATRHPMIFDVPTTSELNYPEVRMNTWFGLLAPSGTQQRITDRIGKEIEQILQTNNIKETLFSLGCEPAFLNSSMFSSFIVEESKKWGALISSLSIDKNE